MATITYKTTKKYKCPYCDYKDIRGKLVDHVDNKHQDLIPEGYTAARAVYDAINGKNYGICMICKTKVYKWNDKINRYYNLCDNPACRKAVRDTAVSRNIKVYGKASLLDDPDQQAKMLAGRKISGTYTFTDGGKATYTGKYERNALEFMDKVLNIPSKDIQTPGPVLEYEYNGTKHFWITDIYYIPANLVIEIKDGGSNPNKRNMADYRAKQITKEVMMTELGKFNYIRLTDNNFAQLLDIFADMKNEALNEEIPGLKYHINEEVGGLPPNRPPEAYVIPYGMNNVFDGFAYGDSELDKILTVDSDNRVMPLVESKFRDTYSTGKKLYYTGKDINEKMEKIHEAVKSHEPISHIGFVGMLLNRNLRRYEEIFIDKCFKYYDESTEDKINKLIENGVVQRYRDAVLRSSLTEEAYMNIMDSNVIKRIGYVSICQSPYGYYAATPSNYYMATDYFPSLDALISSDAIELMNNVYKANSTGYAIDTEEE